MAVAAAGGIVYRSDCNVYCSCGRHKEIAMAKDYRLEKRKFVIGGIALSIAVSYTHLDVYKRQVLRSLQEYMQTVA